MYYIVHDKQDPATLTARNAVFGDQEVFISASALYGKKNVYILPSQEGSYIIGGIEFFRNERGILVKQSAQY